MKLYDELSSAVKETLDSTNESMEFKSRFEKLIENYFDDSYTERDINEVISQISIPEENSNEN